MSLKGVYERFLADPRSAPLASDVSLIYITSTTQINGPDAVVNQLTRHKGDLKVNAETVIGVIEGSNSLCLDIETTVEFVSAGGVYLPGLDEAFLVDRVATFPTIHIVHFNSQNQIQSVRVYWDQGSLLKSVEIIGARNRQWPIRDADKQTLLIKSSAASTSPGNGAAPSAARAPAPAKQEGGQSREALGASPGKKHIKDPYAAESLFELLSPGKERPEPVRPPRSAASAAPPPRDLGELFVGDEDDDTPEATHSRNRAIAPKIGAGKNYRPSRIFDTENPEEASTPVAPKIGAGKNYRPSRIFGTDEDTEVETHEQIAYRTHPKRFDHFELGADNSEREIKANTASRPVSRHVAQWNFEDFSTPPKPRREPRGEEVRHFGWSDDEPEQNSPPARPRVVQPRRDAETHFSLTDQADYKGGRIISSFQNKGAGLYKTTLYDEEDVDALTQPGYEADQAPPLSVVQNGPNRKKDFESHWTVTDEPSPVSNKTNLENKKPVTSDRQKAVKMMESSWDAPDQSPEPTKMAPPQRRQLRNANQRSWGLGDEDDM